MLMLMLLLLMVLHGLDGSESREDAADHCHQPMPAMKELHKQIESDLRHWKDEGITSDLMDELVETRTISTYGQKAIGVMFKDGRPFILSNLSHIHSVGHHTRLLVGHLLLFQSLSKKFGKAVPDVEFVVSSFDVPQVLLSQDAPKGRRKGKEKDKERPPLLPILRFCGSEVIIKSMGSR